MAKKTTTKSADAKAAKKAVVALTHEEAKRKNIPTAEFQPVMAKELQSPIRVAYERRNRDLDPQLVWRGKDDQDWSDLVVPAPPLFIQEKVHAKALVDDLRRQTEAAELAKKIAEGRNKPVEEQFDLFADFNGLPSAEAKTEFYEHDSNWANRMILGDSLQVMASLAEREGLRGQVQCVYFDPPYGIKFNSNFQWSTTTQDVQDGKADHITREPEQVKAFRDTWRDGIHSYLTYVRDRISVIHDLLTRSGSLFVQIGDENVHRVRAVLDEVFGDTNCVSLIAFVKTGGLTQDFIKNKCDYILWYTKDRAAAKSRELFAEKSAGGEGGSKYTGIELSDTRRMTAKQAEALLGQPLPTGTRSFRLDKTTSEANAISKVRLMRGDFEGRWKTTEKGMQTLERAARISPSKNILNYVRYIEDFPAQALSNVWDDIGGIQSRSDPKVYVVQTATEAIKRCLLMASDPGDLVLDPTCGSGTTAFVAEEWGRRWITIDTSRVALALARARVMGAKYPYYLLADSREGQVKIAELNQSVPLSSPTTGSLRQGFVYDRVPHITLGSIANNAEIDVIWEKFQHRLEPYRTLLNKAVKESWEEWQIPRDAEEGWSKEAKEAHSRWWEHRIQRQKEIDSAIERKAREDDFEYLYDKPHDDKKKVRVAGPFTVESLSPHRTLGVDENDELIDPVAAPKEDSDAGQDFARVILENLKAAGVQQAHKEDRITFSSIAPWPGRYIGAEGRYAEGENAAEKRAAIFIGPEFGTVSRQDLVVAAREAGDADFDVLIACAFNYEAHASEFNKLGRIPVLKARMNAELHMGSELKTTGKGNLFVIFGEPDIRVFTGGPSLTAELALRRRRVNEIPEELKQTRLTIAALARSVGDESKGKELARAKQREQDLTRELDRAQRFLVHAETTTPTETFVELYGVDVFHPQTGEVRSDGAEGIACWFIDTDYNEESFFVRHAYFLGANDPYKALKTTLKAEVNEEAWATLHSDTSRLFPKPKGGKIAVKVINHLGDEVMKVFKVE